MKLFKPLVILSIIANTLTAQLADLSFERLASEDGLIDQYAEFVYRDSYNFLWISSANGLQRFDGLEMKVYKANPSDTTSLHSNFIQSDF